jgi:hypothetical protein
MISKEKAEGFIPIFKEKTDKEQFIFKNNEWVRTNEINIMSMWIEWGKRKDGLRYNDKDGFTVYGYKI